MNTPPVSPAKIRVMIVDDSAIVRGLITRALQEDGRMEIVASVANGLMAISAAKAHKPEMILLDIEMPEMDGITALPKLVEVLPQARILMVSTLTQRNAEISLKALELGAADYVTKPSSREDPQTVAAFYREIIEKILALTGKRHMKQPPAVPPAAASAAPVRPRLSAAAAALPGETINALAIGSSTGGPQALNTLVTALKSGLKHIPIFITQHMPPTFTTILAEHLGKASGKPCMEGKDGMLVEPGTIYVAPGNFHMVPEKQSNGAVMIRLNQNAQENFCRPAVDPMLRGLSAIYGKGLLVAILTGMGSDGRLGAEVVKHAGGTIIAQDEASCVVWGMPRAIAENNLAKAILPLDQIGLYILKACGGK